MFVNWLPVICMPSPESPQKRMTALSMVSFLRPEISTNVLDMMIQDLDSKLAENREGLDCVRPYLFDALGPDFYSAKR